MTSNKIYFRSSMKVASPLRTRLTISGEIRGHDDGRPRLVKDSLEIDVVGVWARLAMSTLGIEGITEEALNGLPNMIKETLPARLEKLGYFFEIDKIEIYFADGSVAARVTGHPDVSRSLIDHYPSRSADGLPMADCYS